MSECRTPTALQRPKRLAILVLQRYFRRWSPHHFVNQSLRCHGLAGIPPKTFEYRLGNRSALDWVIDQYQVKEDNRGGIRSNPNPADAPKDILRLVGKVVRVSLETVGIEKRLPGEYGW